jgi:hypothetical protein
LELWEEFMGADDEDDNGKLVVDCDRNRWRLSWAFEDDVGGSLGQNSKDGEGEPLSGWSRGDWEHWAASKAVKNLPGVERDSCGFYWESEAQARKALRVAKEALKQERPLPEWAVQALKAGWKPPKNWKA